MKEVLEKIELRFREKDPNGFFIIVSLTRTVEEELKANPQISEDSTHLKGEAIDFAGKFM